MNLISSRSITTLVALALFVLIVGCTEDPSFPAQSVTVQATGLPSPGPNAHYQLWFSYPEESVAAPEKGDRLDHGDQSFFSVGAFTIDIEGGITGFDGAPAVFVIPDGFNPNLLIDAILTLEEGTGDAATPGPRLLAGEFRGTTSEGRATLLLSGIDAFGTGLSGLKPDSVAGSYILETPTTATAADYANGIWFVDPQGEPSLPLLLQPLNQENPNWTYEAWLVHNVGAPSNTIEYISLGTFDNPRLPDSNGPGSDNGSFLDGFQAPGEDFVPPGVMRLLTDGSYGVIVAMQPKHLHFSWPFLPLLEARPIPGILARAQASSLIVSSAQPSMEITVAR